MIKIGNKSFKNKTTLTTHCKYILNTAELNKPLVGEWKETISALFAKHEGFEEKTQGQDFTIGVRKCFINPRNRQFYITRADGSTTDFSYKKAITPSNKLVEVKATLQEAVQDQRFDYKTKYFEEHKDSLGYVRCAETNLKIKMKESHVDHYPLQMDEIIQSWADSRGIVSSEIKLVSKGDNSAAWDMEDQELLQDFKDYHQSVAQYRIVLGKVNLQRGRAARATF